MNKDIQTSMEILENEGNEHRFTYAMKKNADNQFAIKIISSTLKRD